MPSTHFVVTCDTEFVLCRTALMDCFRHAIFFYFARDWVKILPQDSPSVEFDTTPTQSRAEPR